MQQVPHASWCCLAKRRTNRSAKLGWQKERARPAKSYCQPMMHFIFILQVDLVGNWLLYSTSREMSSNYCIYLISSVNTTQ